MKNQKKKKKRLATINRRLLIVGSILVIVVLVIAILLFTLKDDTFDTTITLNFKDRTKDSLEFKYKDYYTVGWLQVQGTNIDSAILNVDDFTNETGIFEHGWRSNTYATNENREVVIGHNFINVSSTPIRDMSMLNYFEGLMAFTYYDFAQDNLYISYTKDGVEELYKIYAVGFYDYAGYSDMSMSNPIQIKEYIEETRKNSIYDYDIDVNENDRLLTVKTCTRYFGAFGKRQFIVDARRVREGEKIEKYEVKKNENFDKLSEGAASENG